MRFWISWIQQTEDFRPINYPPNEAILGWWCSGCTADEEPILCACVDAQDDSDAEHWINKEWPEASEWRFFQERPGDWIPGDRFPLSDWMKPRFQH